MDPSRINLEDDQRGLTGIAFRPGNQATYLGEAAGLVAWAVTIRLRDGEEIQAVEVSETGEKRPRMIRAGEVFEGLEILASQGEDAFRIGAALALTGVELRGADQQRAIEFAELLRQAAADRGWALPLRLSGESRALQLTDQGRVILRYLSDELERDESTRSKVPASERLALSDEALATLRKRIARADLLAYKINDHWYIVLENLAPAGAEAARRAYGREQQEPQLANGTANGNWLPEYQAAEDQTVERVEPEPAPAMSLAEPPSPVQAASTLHATAEAVTLDSPAPEPAVDADLSVAADQPTSLELMPEQNQPTDMAEADALARNGSGGVSAPVEQPEPDVESVPFEQAEGGLADTLDAPTELAEVQEGTAEPTPEPAVVGLAEGTALEQSSAATEPLEPALTSTPVEVSAADEAEAAIRQLEQDRPAQPAGQSTDVEPAATGTMPDLGDELPEPDESQDLPSVLAMGEPEATEPEPEVASSQAVADDEPIESVADREPGETEPELEPEPEPEPAAASSFADTPADESSEPEIQEELIDDGQLVVHLEREVQFLRRQIEEKDRQIACWVDENSLKGGMVSRFSERVLDGPASLEPGLLGELDRTQLEAIRDEWLQPLVDQIRELERQIGQFQSDRAHGENGIVPALSREYQELRDRLGRLEESRERVDVASSPAGTAPTAPWWRRILR